ncbi:MAG: hypothetical protein Q8L24_01445 [bacterium]|nr:hypothetical protein [bacterium]
MPDQQVFNVSCGGFTPAEIERGRLLMDQIVARPRDLDQEMSRRREGGGCYTWVELCQWYDIPLERHAHSPKCTYCRNLILMMKRRRQEAEKAQEAASQAPTLLQKTRRFFGLA